MRNYQTGEELVHAGLTNHFYFPKTASLAFLFHCVVANSILKDPFTQAIFAAIFLLLMHAIKWIDLQMY